MMFREKKKKKKSSLNLSFWRSLAQIYARICDTIFPWNKNLEYVLVLHHLVETINCFPTEYDLTDFMIYFLT